jgi:hypothetical protein
MVQNSGKHKLAATFSVLLLFGLENVFNVLFAGSTFGLHFQKCQK